MGRDELDKKKRKRHHSHHSKYEDSDSEDDESSSDSSSSSSSSSSDTSSSEEERRRRKRKKARRSSEGSEKRRSKSKLKRRKSSTKSKDKKSKKSKKASKADIGGEISMDDYFLRSAEFRTWLSKERGVFFSDLSSEESRNLFKKFVSKWNSGSLNKSYYGGIQSSAVGHSAQSNYQWQFSSKVNSGDLKDLRDNVSAWSSSKDTLELGPHPTTSTHPAPTPVAAAASSSRPAVPMDSQSIGPHPFATGANRIMGPSRGPTGDAAYRGAGGGDRVEEEERREMDIAQLKRERKEFKKRQELMLDEMLPKATGKEARFEKKKIRAEKRREREISPESNSNVYGTTSTGSIREKVKARQDKRQNKAHAAVQKISDYHAKEKATVEAIMQMARANKKDGALW